MPSTDAARKNALELIRDLFSQAAEAESPADASRFVQKARRAAQRQRMRLPKEYSKRFCRHCGAYWKQGSSVRVRLQKQKVVYYCLGCRHYTRHPYVREKKGKPF
ncbi:ribonuclease P [Candidatus Woesearchaeota archaeon]|nr:ribonuclease P [Candidatus Woesearchaeota archaeon]